MTRPARAIADGVHSCRRVKALTEKMVSDALAAIDQVDAAAHNTSPLAPEHHLIQYIDVYGDLFSRCAAPAEQEGAV